MTERGFEMPPDHIVLQMLSTLALSSPVIMVVLDGLVLVDSLRSCSVSPSVYSKCPDRRTPRRGP